MNHNVIAAGFRMRRSPQTREARGKPAASDKLNVALLIPRSGPAGLFGLSCELSARLAAEELNQSDGAAGREIRLIPVDGGAPPRHIAREADRLASSRRRTAA